MNILSLLVFHILLLVSPISCAYIGITQIHPESILSRQFLSGSNNFGLQKILSNILPFKKQSQADTHSLKHDEDVLTPTLPPPRPVVIWHGLGDTYDSTGMKRAAAAIKNAKPHTFVYAIRLSNDSSTDQQATLFGKVNEQVSFFFLFLLWLFFPLY